VATDPLRAALEKKYSKRHIDRLVTAKANGQALTRRVAMLAVARDLGMNWTRYATPDEIAAVGGTARPAGPASPAPAPTATAAAARTSSRGTRGRDAVPRPKGPRNKVFVVHGRNKQIRSAMFTFLRDVNLSPVEWGEALSATGKATPYIAEALEAAIKDVAAVVVLISPDDIVRLKKQFLGKDDGGDEREPQGQGRPNVLFESGMAFGLHPEKTVFVTFGRVKPFTDIGGMHVVRMNNTATKRNQLADKLRTAKADVRTEGRTDWLDETRSNFNLKDEDDADNEAP
jgi:predicted nucleotide-binding protein